MRKETRMFTLSLEIGKQSFGILENHETWFRDNIIKPPRVMKLQTLFKVLPQIKCVGLAGFDDNSSDFIQRRRSVVFKSNYQF